MRNAINSQLLSFKNEKKDVVNCLLCNVALTDENRSADHHPIPFKTLRESFLKSPLSQSERSWQLYHLKNAQLQILCSSCNSKKGCL